METNYQTIAKEARTKVLELIYKAQVSHIGSNFSAIDIMAVLFEKMDLDKDKFILSAGWKAAALYYFLWRKGRITEEELNSYCQPGSKFIGLSEPIHPDIFFAGGSMSMGLPAAVGFALAKKMKGEEGKIYVLMSDGELQCGTTWESTLIAAHHNLHNLVVIVDENKLQAMGEKNKILRSFFPSEEWGEWIIDGHDYIDIRHKLTLSEAVSIMQQPQVIIAHTIKGKGVSFMENNNLYHYKAPSDEEYQLAMKELNG